MNFFRRIFRRRWIPTRGVTIIPSRYDGEGFKPLSPGLRATETIVFHDGPPAAAQTVGQPFEVDLSRYFTPDTHQHREDQWSPELRVTWRMRLRDWGIRLGIVRRGLVSTEDRTTP